MFLRRVILEIINLLLIINWKFKKTYFLIIAVALVIESLLSNYRTFIDTLIYN